MSSIACTAIALVFVGLYVLTLIAVLMLDFGVLDWWSQRHRRKSVKAAAGKLVLSCPDCTQMRSHQVGRGERGGE